MKTREIALIPALTGGEFPLKLKSTDTTSPYQYSWDSTSVSNGTHTLKAVAYNTSNLTSEASVTVTVLNAVSNQASGFVLDGYGGIHPFSGAPKLNGYPPYFGWNIARRMVLVSDSSGYILDGYGGIHPFGASLNPGPSTYWKGWDIAKDIAVRSDGKSGYVLDGYGGIHPFGGAPRISSPPPYFGWNIARRIKLVQ